MKKSRLIASILLVAMVLALTACGTPAASTTAPASVTTPSSVTQAPQNTDAPTAEPREHYEISVFFPMHASASLEDVPEGGYMLDKAYEEMFDITLDIQRIPNTNAEEMYNTMIASRQIPDIVKQGSWSSLHKYADAWWDLNDFIIGKYANLEEYFYNDDYVFALSAEESGQIKILSMLSEQYVGDVLMVRGDLLEEWNIDITQYKTKEDIVDLLRLVQQTDPTVVPYMTRMQTQGLTQRLSEGWSGIKQYEFVDEATDTVMYGAADARMKEVVQWLRDLYAEGLIDQEYSTNTTTQWQEQLLNNGIFMTHDNASSRIRWAYNEWANLGVTDKYYVAIPPIQPDANTIGQTTIHYPKLRDAAAIYIGASEGEVDRILEIFDYNFGEEGNILVNYGYEGVSFQYGADGQIEDIPEYRAAVDADTMPQKDRVKGDFAAMIRREANGIYSPQNRSHAVSKDIEAAAVMYEDGGLIRNNMISVIRFTDAEQSEVNALNADIKTYTDENLDQFIMGIRSMDEWDTFVAGYDNVNLSRYVELYNTAYERAKDLLNN